MQKNLELSVGMLSVLLTSSHFLLVPFSFLSFAYNWFNTGSIFNSNQYDKIFSMQSNISVILTIEIKFTKCVPWYLCALISAQIVCAGLLSNTKQLA